MTPIEIIALIILVAAAIKILVILIKPSSWMGMARTVWKQPALTAIVSLILAAIVLYYLLQEITIIQIFAVMAFVALLAALSMAAYSAEIIALGQKMLKDKAVVKKAWLSIVVWIVLIAWGFYVLFA